ncbi:hypothetical protein U1Q18_000751 [Sarracenia purpurea var. burkii]
MVTIFDHPTLIATFIHNGGGFSGYLNQIHINKWFSSEVVIRCSFGGDEPSQGPSPISEDRRNPDATVRDLRIKRRSYSSGSAAIVSSVLLMNLRTEKAQRRRASGGRISHSEGRRCVGRNQIWPPVRKTAPLVFWL